MKVLILGHTGMLGNAVYRYLTSIGLDVYINNYRWDTYLFRDFVRNFTGDFIINCIGSIPQKSSEFSVNIDLPIWLCTNTSCRVIHIDTDDNNGFDMYSISKKIAKNYIKKFSYNTKIIKCSIIGFENGTSYSFLEWFLSSSDKVSGHTGHIWNGITTLEWAKQAYMLMLNWNLYEVETIIEGERMSKYDMLNLFKTIFNKDIDIEGVDIGEDKSLKGPIKTKSLSEQVLEMKKFYGR